MEVTLFPKTSDYCYLMNNKLSIDFGSPKMANISAATFRTQMINKNTYALSITVHRNFLLFRPTAVVCCTHGAASAGVSTPLCFSLYD